jgi:hypothetical protein
MTSPSYKKSKCCGGLQDCSLLDENEGEICWGQVKPESPGDDPEGFPIRGHLCQGHRDAWDWHVGNLSYYPEA